MRAALAAVALVALALPASAFAHANLLERAPTYGAKLETSPKSVSLRFDQSVDVFASSIDVRSSTGRVVTAGPAHTIDEGRVATVPLRRLPKGAYTVRWHATSNEGHVLSGVYTFGVRVVPPPPTEAYGAGGITASEHFVKWGYFVGLALLVGGLAFRLLVLGSGRLRVSSGASTGSSGSASSRASSSGSSASSCARETRSSSRSDGSCTETSRRWRRERASARRSSP